MERIALSGALFRPAGRGEVPAISRKFLTLRPRGGVSYPFGRFRILLRAFGTRPGASLEAPGRLYLKMHSGILGASGMISDTSPIPSR
jgi:hypothetical protein